MSKFWNWLKTAFVKAQPTVHALEPAAVGIASKLDPKLAPSLAVAQSVIEQIREASDKKN